MQYYQPYKMSQHWPRRYTDWKRSLEVFSCSDEKIVPLSNNTFLLLRRLIGFMFLHLLYFFQKHMYGGYLIHFLLQPNCQTETDCRFVGVTVRQQPLIMWTRGSSYFIFYFVLSRFYPVSSWIFTTLSGPLTTKAFTSLLFKQKGFFMLYLVLIS